MFEMLKSCARSVGVAGAAMTVVAAAALPGQVLAGEAAAAAPAQATGVVADGLIAVRDSATGQLRAPTAEEAASLRPSKAAATRMAPAGDRIATGAVARAHASGAVGARLTDEMMSYSVVVKQRDGSLREFCFSSRAAAEAATASLSKMSTDNNLPTE